jgi:hypothetical protein
LITAVQIVSANLYLAGLLIVAVYVRNWILLAIWLGLLLGGFLALFVGSKRRKFAPFFFMGGATLFIASVIVGGETLWTGYLGMVIAIANFWTYDRHRPPPAPVRPEDPAFKDPVFTAAAIGLVVSGLTALLILTNVMPAAWLGPVCGACGFAFGILVLAMARWQVTR